jgi:CubicO group peptidase (beta-lactamase class C family)
VHRRRTRALVVVHGGRIVAERYAPGFDATMPLIGWSMAKMATNALVGIAVQNGKLNLTDKELCRSGGERATHAATLRSISFCA